MLTQRWRVITPGWWHGLTVSLCWFVLLHTGFSLSPMGKIVGASGVGWQSCVCMFCICHPWLCLACVCVSHRDQRQHLLCDPGHFACRLWCAGSVFDVFTWADWPGQFMVGLFALLCMPWFMSFEAMRGVCYFLRVTHQPAARCRTVESTY